MAIPKGQGNLGIKMTRQIIGSDVDYFTSSYNELARKNYNCNLLGQLITNNNS